MRGIGFTNGLADEGFNRLVHLCDELCDGESELISLHNFKPKQLASIALALISRDESWANRFACPSLIISPA